MTENVPDVDLDVGLDVGIPEIAEAAPMDAEELGSVLEALLLVVLEGASYAEAADMLGIPIGTLMSRLGRARTALRKLTGTVEEPRLRTVK